MRIKSLPSASVLEGKKILLRLDLNEPVSGGRLESDYKIRAALPIIKQLRKNPLIIISHLGEPETGKGSYRFEKKFSLLPVAKRLEKLLGRRIVLKGGSWQEIRRAAAQLRSGEIMLLENIRFWPGETANDADFAKRLASLADMYVNDAFAVSHRKHASVAAVKKFLPAYAGPLLEAEASQLDKVAHGRRPLVVVMGGAKISSKLPLIKKFLPRAQNILLGGGLANDMLKERGFNIGRSYCDTDALRAGRRLASPKISLPTDVITAAGKSARVKNVAELGDNDVIVDIGPRTAREYGRIIRTAQTVIWNGPMGIFEKAFARQGTTAILAAMAAAAQRGAVTAVGGGETVEAVLFLKKSRSVGWVSTGGGASLSFLAGEAMPGLSGLVR